ncbi:MAG: antibiotic biosynthesis monooxygenase [Actinomycetota bacterium]|nr:antibiotic biosynthesis monooxygenase [Actinomycetota bacterium]
MIFIVVKWTIRPERSDEWLTLVSDFTAATRAEPGNLFFEWSRSVDVANQFVLVEAFADGGAGAAHVGSEHFKAAIDWMPDVVAETPEIVNVEIPDAQGWSRMGEVAPRS